MSGFELGSNQAWQEAFFEPQVRSAPTSDTQPGWVLTAIGVALGIAAIVMLSF